jgi:hypothetical protein
VFYDTRDHPAPYNQQDVKIGLYYCRGIPDGQGGLTIEPNVRLESEAIYTPYLTNPTWIGDYISITTIPWDNGHDAAVAVWMGTNHKRSGLGDGPGIPIPDNETIFSTQIVQDN